MSVGTHGTHYIFRAARALSYNLLKISSSIKPDPNIAPINHTPITQLSSLHSSSASKTCQRQVLQLWRVLLVVSCGQLSCGAIIDKRKILQFVDAWAVAARFSRCRHSGPCCDCGSTPVPCTHFAIVGFTLTGWLLNIHLDCHCAWCLASHNFANTAKSQNWKTQHLR